MFEQHHYGKLAGWVKEVALVIFAALVVQKIFAGFPVTDRDVLLGGVLSILLYTTAVSLLRKS